jgi:hypothetical protein
MNPRQPCVVEPKSGPDGRPTLSELSTIKVFPCLFAPFAWSRPPRPTCQPEIFAPNSPFKYQISRQCHPNIALFPRRFCAVFEGGIYYPLRPNYLRSRPLKPVQFPVDIACRADLPPPRRRTCRAEAIRRRANPLSPQNCAFSLHFPLHILKTHPADRCGPTTYARCPRKLCNSELTLTPEWPQRPAAALSHVSRTCHAGASARRRVTPASSQKYTVSTPFLHRFSIHFSLSDCPSTTCKSRFIKS